jgi:hypothetical protein
LCSNLVSGTVEVACTTLIAGAVRWSHGTYSSDPLVVHLAPQPSSALLNPQLGALESSEGGLTQTGPSSSPLIRGP